MLDISAHTLNENMDSF